MNESVSDTEQTKQTIRLVERTDIVTPSKARIRLQ